MKKFEMPSVAQIKNWKTEHGTLHKLTVKVPGQDDAICIVRDPKVSDIAQSSAMGDGDAFKIGKIQLDNCWLDGDERINSRLAFTKAAAEQMGRIFEVFPWSVETVDVTPDLLSKMEEVKLPIKEAVVEEGVVRKITILNGALPVYNDKKEDTREKVVAYFKCPDLPIQQKVDLIPDFLDKGNLYINECFLIGDERFKNHSSEPVAFASYMAGHSLIEIFTTEVEKL